MLKRFDEVFKSLKAISGNDKPSFTLEGLNEKSLALKMHTGMHDLVKSYLNFYNIVNGTHVNRLVLLIDDIDMTVSHAPEMLEQLRKYLDIENVVILMSANLAQLYNEMREHYSQAFKETLKDRNQALYIDVEDLANKYLLKLFPTSRRVRVEHSVKQLIEANLEINVDLSSGHIVQLSDARGTFYGNYEMDEGEVGGSLDYNSIVVAKSKLSEIKEKQSVKGKLQNVILSLIWEKTRLLFIPKDPDNVLHPIIPTNLRELMQFLDMLTSLEEVKYKEGEKTPKLFWDRTAYESCKNNVAKFKKYFLHNWIPSHLPVEEELVFNNIPADITEINKHLINSINVIGNKHKNDLMSREVSLDMIERNAEDVISIDRDIYTMVSLNDPKFIKANKISDIFNQPSNYSYGDLLLMIDKYETYFESGDNRKFTDAIKIYYSILLFETMFFGSTGVIYDRKQLTKNSKGNLESPRLIPIQQLIGGTVYYPNYFEIIEDKYFNQKGPSYDAKRAFYHKVEVGDGKNVGENYPFFAVLYYGDIRPDRYDTKHIYDTTFTNNARIDGTDYVTFDILSILSNMLNPWHTYSRAEDRVYESGSWSNKINRWSESCKIEPKDNSNDQPLYTPNSILPFYSVDMMLNYLKESIEVSKIIASYPESVYKKFDTLKIEGRKSLFSEDSSGLTNAYQELKGSMVSYILELLRPLNIAEQTLIVLHNSLANQKYEEAKGIVNGISETEEEFIRVTSLEKKTDGFNSKYNEWRKNQSNIKKDVENWIDEIALYSEQNADGLLDLVSLFPDKYKKNLAQYVSILSESLPQPTKDGKTFKDKPSYFQFEDVTNFYLNQVISLLLNKYPESQKERDKFIKELHKCHTPSEIFKHLVESLWDIKMTEICIRSDIQERVRKENSVEKYYSMLWNKTEQLLKISNSNAVVIYKYIFDKAAHIFITKDHSDPDQPSRE